MFSVGEVSGDRHAGDLAAALLRLRPEARLFGAGGEHMAASGVDVRLDITDASTFGLRSLFGALPQHVRSALAIRRMLKRERPDALVVVDAPALNLPLARAARRLGIRTVYYVPPQTWLWRPDSATRRLRRSADLIVPIFDREAEVYRQRGLSVVYHGHPMADLAAAPRRSADEIRRQLDLPASGPVVGVFPGSRRAEIAQLLPAMLEAMARVGTRVAPPHLIVAVASSRLRPFIEQTLGPQRGRVRLSNNGRDVLGASDVTLAASGTVLMEAAALDVPAIMTYRLDGLSYLYGKYVLRVRRQLDFYSMPNILMAEAVIPELVLERAEPGHMADAIVRYLTDSEARARMLDGYARLRARLGSPGVAGRVAASVLRMISGDRDSN